ncbi:MAG: TIGR00730 family Rossman fold protein [Chloroflexota bacterium]|nr:TIGR00730 family Rossman fold protein [Dehalococcoidia bacterium]MDW8254175.1 TIGR00730 family Rossman fold protein [Chloroflexota bacterium]
MHAVCVFCGSNVGNAMAYRAAAEEVGSTLADLGITLVYGGGQIGLMGVVADAALARGGRVIGVIPEPLAIKEVAHAGLTELHLVSSMHERKALMMELSDGFIALPGGFGTLEEFFEVVTWGQLGIHRKPCGLLNVAGYYDPLIRFLDAAVEHGFIAPEHRQLVLEDSSIAGLLRQMQAYRPPTTTKWVTITES